MKKSLMKVLIKSLGILGAELDESVELGRVDGLFGVETGRLMVAAGGLQMSGCLQESGCLDAELLQTGYRVWMADRQEILWALKLVLSNGDLKIMLFVLVLFPFLDISLKSLK